MNDPEKNLQLTKRWFNEVWNLRRENTIDELLSPEAKGTGMSDDGFLDFNSFKSVWRAFLETFPDLHVEVEEWVAGGDKVAVHLTCTGTHEGSGLGFPPSGKKVRFEAQTIATWKRGQIIAARNVIDFSPLQK